MDSQFHSIDLYAVFIPVPHSLDYCNFVTSFEIVCESSNCVRFKIVFGYSGFFNFQINFRIIFQIYLSISHTFLLPSLIFPFTIIYIPQKNENI